MTSIIHDDVQTKQPKDEQQDGQIRKSSTEHQYMVKHEYEDPKRGVQNGLIAESPFHSNHKIVKDVDGYLDDDDEQDDLNVESPTDTSTKRSLGGSTRRDGGAGSSCHQCKSAKDPSSLLFCSSTAEKNVRKRRCRKKYCDSCLKRSYPASLAAAQPNDNSWCCPSCLGCCVCAACTRSSDESRHDGIVEGINSLSQLHPQILSYLGVQPDRLAELQIFLAHQSDTSPNPFGVIDAQTQATLTQLIQTMQAHDSVTKSLNQMLLQSQSSTNDAGQLLPNSSYGQNAMSNYAGNQSAHSETRFVDQNQNMMVNSSLAFSLNSAAQQSSSNDWMMPATPSARLMRAEIDLTATPIQPTACQSHNISPLHQSQNVSGNAVMQISPLHHVRNQSYHSVGGSTTGSPSSTATTSSVHSRPVSPTGFTRPIHSSDQNYSLISSNPTSEMHHVSRIERFSNQIMFPAANQYSQTALSGQQQWSSIDTECEARRHTNLTSSTQFHHNHAEEMSGIITRPPVEFEGFSNSCYPTVETRKRAHSACMSDATGDHGQHFSAARQRVSPPAGIPRSIKSSNTQPRKRSPDQAFFHSRKSSQEQLESEMTRQMQQQSLNQQSMISSNFSFSPSLSSLTGQSALASMPPSYDMHHSDQTCRYSYVQPYDEQHLVDQSIPMLDQQTINQSFHKIEQQLIDSNMSQQLLIQMNPQTHQSFYHSNNQYTSMSNHRADVMNPVTQAEDMIQRCRELHQLTQAQQIFNHF